MSDRRLVGAVVLSAASSAAGVALMAASAWLLSRAAEHPPVLFLMVAIVAVRAFGLSRGVFRYLERLLGHDVALRRQAALRVQVFQALARGTWVGRRSGDLLSRVVNDVAAVQDRVVRVIVPLAAAGVVAAGTDLLLTVIWPPAGLLVLAATLLGGVLVPWWAGHLSADADRSLAPLRGAMADAVTEAHAAAPDLWAYGAAEVLLRRVRAADAALRRAEQRAATVAGLAAAAQLVTTGAAVLAGLLTAAHAVAAGDLPPVQVAVLTLTPLALHEVVAGLPAALAARNRTDAALSRVDDLLRAPATGNGDRNPTGRTGDVGAGDVGTGDVGTVDVGAVDLDGVSIAWPGGPPVVEGLDLHVRAGERVALVGPSGSGKTTVAAAVLGLLPPCGGSLRVTGSVGLLAQDAHLFDTTVGENLRIGDREATEDACRDALRRVGLDLPLERLVGEHGSRLSGGEAQRVALARLLLRRDEVVVLDEPTEHLDRATADALLEDLLALTRDAALLVVTHDPTLIARCDRTVVLEPTPVPAQRRGRERPARNGRPADPDSDTHTHPDQNLDEGLRAALAGGGQP